MEVMCRGGGKYLWEDGRIISLSISRKSLTGILDVSGLTNLSYLDGSNQRPTVTLTGKNNSYSAAISLNNPTELAPGVSYSNGTLSSNSKTITTSNFSVRIVGIRFYLSGVMNLLYEEEIPNVAIRQPDHATIVYVEGVRLYVDSPIEEMISVYTVSGRLVFQGMKQAGNYSVPLGVTSEEVLIVKGRDWGRKVLLIAR